MEGQREGEKREKWRVKGRMVGKVLNGKIEASNEKILNDE